MSIMTIGKRTSDATYFHVSACAGMPEAIRSLIYSAALIAHVSQDDDYNVVKIAHTHKQVSLLFYSSFWDDPFPKLATAWTVNLSRKECSMRRYQATGNPPILHRKELLIDRAHPSYSLFSRLSEQLAALGLSAQSPGLGFQRQWLAKLASAAVSVSDHTIVEGTAS